MKKIPTQLSIDELLKTLEETPKAETANLDKPSEHSVILFLADYGIYPGSIEIESGLLYKLYKYNRYDDSCSGVEFNLILRGYLKYRQTVNKTYYYCNQDSKNLTKILADFLQKRRYNKVNKKFYKEHFDKFCSQNNISKGDVKIPTSVLYFFYDKWKYNVDNSKTTITYNDFTALLRVHFKTKRTNKYWVTYINNEFFSSLKEGELDTAIEWAKKYNEKSKKTKKAKSTIKR